MRWRQRSDRPVRAIKTRGGVPWQACLPEHSLPQEALALRSGLHRTYVSSADRGERNVALVNIERLAKALEVDISDLFARTSDPDWRGECPTRSRLAHAGLALSSGYAYCRCSSDMHMHMCRFGVLDGEADGQEHRRWGQYQGPRSRRLSAWEPPACLALRITRFGPVLRHRRLERGRAFAQQQLWRPTKNGRPQH
jgi:hypothetical protein